MKIALKNITKKFGSGFSIEKLNMTVESGKFTTFLGPSGCGKTTVLRMIAGLERPDDGEIWFDGNGIRNNYQVVSSRESHLPEQLSEVRNVFCLMNHCLHWMQSCEMK